MEEAILAIITFDGNKKLYAKRITSMVMKFIIWINKNYFNGTVHIKGDPDMWIEKCKDSNIKDNWHSTNHIFQYWNDNVKDK